MNEVVGCCLGAILGLIVGLVLGAALIWILGQTTDLHGAPLELVGLLVVACVIGGIVLGVLLPPEG